MKKILTPFFLILGLAFLLRVVGVGFGLPGVYHQDEPIVVNHALAYSSGDLNPHFFKIPPLLSYLLFAVYGLFYGLMHFFAGWDAHRYASLFFRDPSLFYLSGRLIFGVALGTCSVAVLYRLGQRYFSERVAATGALFFAASFFHVRDSHYMYVDIPMILFILLAFLCLADYQKGEKPSRALWAGVCGGVAVAFKYIAAPLFIPFFFVLRRRPKILLSVALVSVSAYFFLNPYTLLDHHFFWKEIHAQSQAEAVSPPLHHLVYSLFGGQGVWIVLSGLVGSLLLFKKRAELRHLVLFVFLWYGMTLCFSQPFERYAMPIAPFLCLFSAYALSALTDRVIAEKFRKILFAVLVILFLAEPLTKSIYLDWLALRPDTRAAAQAWIVENLPEGSVVALNQPFFCPRLAQTDAQLEEKAGRLREDDPQYGLKKRKLEYLKEAVRGQKRFRVFYVRGQAVGDPSFTTWSPWMDASESDFKRLGVRYIIRYPTPEEDANLSSLLGRHTRLLKTFSPYYSDQKTLSSDPFAHVGLPFLSRELFSRKAPGPYLEVYEWLE